MHNTVDILNSTELYTSQNLPALGFFTRFNKITWKNQNVSYLSKGMEKKKVIHMRQSTCNTFILDVQEKRFQNLWTESKQLYTNNKRGNILLQLSTQHPKRTGRRQCVFSIKTRGVTSCRVGRATEGKNGNERPVFPNACSWVSHLTAHPDASNVMQAIANGKPCSAYLPALHFHRSSFSGKPVGAAPEFV